MAADGEQQKSFISRWLHNQLQTFRYRLAHADALPQLAILGCISGAITGIIAILFRLLCELPLAIALPAGSESFEMLPVATRFFLPIAGALIIGLIMNRTKREYHAVSVGHVLDRMQHHQAQLPLGNGLMQFVGGAIALLTGNSVGREGPAIHLGAVSSSLLGQRMKLPNNSLRILTGCGVAAAISASFNTPLAGVIFAMEVVLMEYTITGFIPIILAAVSGAIVSRVVFGSAPAFTIPALEMGSLWEIPFFVLSGLIIGLLASAMLRLYQHTDAFKEKPVLLRMLFIGLLAGTVAIFVPQIQGVGYDTVEQAMLGQMGFVLLLSIVVAKTLVSTVSISLGLPGGIVGPNFVIGACIGGCLGIAGGYLSPEHASSPGFYAILGMGAMMGAVLNAPLAALIAVLELTYNPNILLPSMLVIVIASITTRTATKVPSIFSIGHDRRDYSSPVFQMLSRAGVTSLMQKNFIPKSRHLSFTAAELLLENKPDWIVIEDVGEPKYLLRPADLARHLCEQQSMLPDDDTIDLRKIPGERWQLHPIHARATLQEALLTMQQNNGHAVFVSRPAAPLMSDVAGIITKDDIDNYYQ